MKIRFFLVLVSILAFSNSASGDSAAVLPQGVARLNLDLYHYQPTTQRYNSDGDREDLAYPFTNAALDSRVLPILAPLDAAVGGVASIGDVSVRYEYDIDVLDFGFSYGLNEQLSIGFHIPYYWITNHVDTSFDTGNANVGLNPGAGPPLIPLGAGGGPLSNDDVQNLIVNGYGFEPIDTWSREGIGDVELGAKYLFNRQPYSALAITAGLRVPTGYEDDADLLDDVAWSFGNYALLLRLHYDFLISRLWNTATEFSSLAPTVGDTVLNLTLRFDYMLPDKKLMRIGDSPDQLFTNNRERVSRKLGNLINLEASLKYQVTEAFAIATTYTYGCKGKDDIDGDMGFNYSSLEADTDSTEQIVILSADYSTLGAFRKNQSKIPMELSLAYRERFDGEGPSSGQANPKLYTRWLVAGVKILY
jgi:hypothetical protein